MSSDITGVIKLNHLYQPHKVILDDDDAKYTEGFSLLCARHSLPDIDKVVDETAPVVHMTDVILSIVNGTIWHVLGWACRRKSSTDIAFRKLRFTIRDDGAIHLDDLDANREICRAMVYLATHAPETIDISSIRVTPGDDISTLQRWLNEPLASHLVTLHPERFISLVDGLVYRYSERDALVPLISLVDRDYFYNIFEKTNSVIGVCPKHGDRFSVGWQKIDGHYFNLVNPTKNYIDKSTVLYDSLKLEVNKANVSILSSGSTDVPPIMEVNGIPMVVTREYILAERPDQSGESIFPSSLWTTAAKNLGLDLATMDARAKLRDGGKAPITDKVAIIEDSLNKAHTLNAIMIAVIVILIFFILTTRL